jgi:hypothetical protein
MYALCFRVLTNGFQINHFRRANIDLDVVFTQDAIADDLQVQLAHSADDGLPVCGSCRNSDGGIFPGETAEDLSEGLVVGVP